MSDVPPTVNPRDKAPPKEAKSLGQPEMTLLAEAPAKDVQPAPPAETLVTEAEIPAPEAPAPEGPPAEIPAPEAPPAEIPAPEAPSS